MTWPRGTCPNHVRSWRIVIYSVKTTFSSEDNFFVHGQLPWPRVMTSLMLDMSNVWTWVRNTWVMWACPPCGGTGPIWWSNMVICMFESTLSLRTWHVSTETHVQRKTNMWPIILGYPRDMSNRVWLDAGHPKKVCGWESGLVVWTWIFPPLKNVFEIFRGPKILCSIT